MQVLVRRLTRHAFTITTFVAFAALLGAVFDPKELPGTQGITWRRWLETDTLSLQDRCSRCSTSFPCCCTLPSPLLELCQSLYCASRPSRVRSSSLFSAIELTLLAAAPAKSPSRFAQLASLTSATSLPVLIAYLIGSAPVFTAYLWCASSVSTDARLGLLFYHKGCAALEGGAPEGADVGVQTGLADAQ